MHGGLAAARDAALSGGGGDNKHGWVEILKENVAELDIAEQKTMNAIF